MTTTKPLDVQTRHHSMRHTDTLAAISSHHMDKSTAGFVLAEEIECLISYNHLSAEELREALAKKVEEYRASKDEAKKRFLVRGAKVDASVYADKS